MNDIHDINPIMDSDILENFIVIFIFCIISILLFYISFRFFLFIINKISVNRTKPKDVKKTRNVKLTVIKKLKKLKEKTEEQIKEDNLDFYQNFIDLSYIFRWFLEHQLGINALAMNKTELDSFFDNKYKKLIELCYIVEFPRNKTIEPKEVTDIIDLAIKFVDDV